MNIRTLVILPALWSVCGLFTGCSTSSNVVIGDAGDTRIEYNDPVTRQRVSIVEVTDYREDNLMRAVVTLRNQTQRNMRVQYRFRWFNVDGAQIMPASDVYLTRLLEGRETAAVQSIAPSPEAVEFRFNVTKANVLERGPNSF